MLLKSLQTKPSAKNMNNNFYEFYYTVIKDRDDIVIEDDKYENIEIDFINFNDFITPNHYTGRKHDSVMLG